MFECHPTLTPVQRCITNHVLLSGAWFLLFTAFASVQNLEASVVSGSCGGCNVDCVEGNSTEVSEGSCMVSTTTTAKLERTQCIVVREGTGYCIPALKGCVSESCRNITFPSGEAVESDVCKSDGNVGSITFGVLYLVFTMSCLCGPYMVQVLGVTRGISYGFVCFTLICAANVIVARDPQNVPLQYAVLLPAAAVVGLAASFMWCAQGTYLTNNAIYYSRLKGCSDENQYLGRFNGAFFACWRLAQIFGNLLASILLQQGVSYTTLFLVYLTFAVVASVLAFQITAIPTTTEEGVKVESPLQSLKGMYSLMLTPSMASLIPLMLYQGLYQGFLFVDFTTNWVKPTVGVSGIGFVMASFGASSVLGSVVLGKISDATGLREGVMSLAIVTHGGFFLLLKSAPPSDCSQQYGVLIAAASLWGIGDAALNTQVGALLGSSFPAHRTHAFSHLKLWQSVATAASFLMNYNPNLFSRDESLTLTFVMLLLAFTFHYGAEVLKSRGVKERSEVETEMILRTDGAEEEEEEAVQPSTPDEGSN